MIKKLFSHTLLYALGPQLPKIVNIFLLPIITAYLTPKDYGIHGTITAYAGLLAGIKMLGFDILLVNAFYKRPQKWVFYWRIFFGALLSWQMIFVFIQFSVLYWLIPKEAGDMKSYILLLIIVPGFFFSIVNSFGGRYYQLAQKPSYIALTTGVSGILTVFITYYTIVILKTGYMGWFISSAASSFIQFLFFFYPILIKHKITPVFTIKKSFWKKYLSIALPTIPHNYSSYLLNSSDRVVLDKLNVPIEKIGLYNLAYIFGNYFEIFGNALGMAVGPFYMKLFAKKNIAADKQIRTLTFFLQILFLFLAFNISLWSKEIFQILISNEELKKAYYLSAIIIMGYSYRPMYWATINKLLFIEKTNKLWRISFVGGMLNVILNLIFIPYFSIEAATVTTFVSLLYIGFAGFFIKDFKANNTQNYRPVLWIVLIIVLTVTVFLIKDINFIIKLIVSTITFAVVSSLYLKNKHFINGINV